MPRNRISKVSKDKIIELAKRIKPIKRFEREGLCYIKPEDLFNVSYIWDAKPAKPAPRMRTICDIPTYHVYGCKNSFKPLIAEVLAQIPEKYLDKVIAFEIIESPKTATDLNGKGEERSADYHVAKTRLYSKLGGILDSIFG